MQPKIETHQKLNNLYYTICLFILLYIFSIFLSSTKVLDICLLALEMFAYIDILLIYQQGIHWCSLHRVVGCVWVPISYFLFYTVFSRIIIC